MNGNWQHLMPTSRMGKPNEQCEPLRATRSPCWRLPVCPPSSGAKLYSPLPTYETVPSQQLCCPERCPTRWLITKNPTCLTSVFLGRIAGWIPAELQSKLSPKSCQMIFMDYPEGVKGYRLHDSSTGTFFIACDVMFDEDLLGNATDEDNEDESVTSSSPPPDTSPSDGRDNGAWNTCHVSQCPSCSSPAHCHPLQICTCSELDRGWEGLCCRTCSCKGSLG